MTAKLHAQCGVSFVFPLCYTKALQRKCEGNPMVSKEADGALCSNGAYITLDQYFLVRSSLKSSSNVPPKATTRENTVTGGLGMIPCLSLFF